MELRCVGGPFDGETINLKDHVAVVQVAGYPDMRYHRTRPTDTNWRAEHDPHWFIRGLPEPVPPVHVLEWHEPDWLSPEVAAIRGTYREAAARHR